MALRSTSGCLSTFALSQENPRGQLAQTRPTSGKNFGGANGVNPSLLVPSKRGMAEPLHAHVFYLPH
jgi:hypothetical protein